MSSRLKRARPSLGEDTLLEGVGEIRTVQQSGAGPAERKRELERNRRNLVNNRFAELENQLARLPGAPKRVYRRIDKEVVLKDATQALAAQQRDLELANSRLTTMTSEVGTLRSEKLELRRDKTFLHKELDASRNENMSLAADNKMLWEALCKVGAVKSLLPSDISKIPFGIVLGKPTPNDCTTSQEARTSTSGAVLSASTPVSNVPSKQDGGVTGGNLGQQLGNCTSTQIILDLEQSLTSGALGSMEHAPLATIDQEFAKIGDELNTQPPPSSSAILAQLSLEMPSTIGPFSDDTAHPDIAPCG